MTLERSHSKLYALRPRSRDLAPHDPPADGPVGRDDRGRFTSTNRAAADRAVKSALTGQLRRAVAQGVAAALGSDATPQTGVQVAREALALYRSACRELGTNSTLARSALVKWAIGSSVANALQLAAVAAGVDSERGLKLLERAERASQVAERSSITAADLARVLRGAAPAADPHARAREAFGKPTP